MIIEIARVLLATAVAGLAGIACVLVWRRVTDWCGRTLDISHGE